MELGIRRHLASALSATASALLLAGCPSSTPHTTTTGGGGGGGGGGGETTPPPAVPTTRFVLPLAGLAVDLPDLAAGATYSLAGSWALSADDDYYGRDVIEEHGADGALLTGTWVMLGYFDERPCDALFEQDEVITFGAPLETRVSGGSTWVLRGGVADLPGLGKLPALRGCTGAADAQKLIVYRFFLGHPETMTSAEMIDAFLADGVVAAVAAAHQARRSAPSTPTRVSDVHNVGEIQPMREVFVESSGFTIALPDDGWVWRDSQADTEMDIDTFERAAPALPETYLEIRHEAFMSCEEQLADIPTNGLAVARGFGTAWIAGPTIDRAEDEHVVCHDYDDGSVMVGIVGTDGDVSAFQPFLDAVAAGVAELM